MNKKGFLVLLIALSGVFAISGRYWGGRGFGRRGWGHRGYGRRGFGGVSIGFGIGRPYGGYYGHHGPYWGHHGYYGRPVYRRRYYDDYADSRGKSYWRVFNDTPYNINFKAEGHEIRNIAPGESRKVPHENGFNFSIRTNTGRTLSSSTSRHSIRVYDRGRGRIGVRKSS